MTPTSYASSSLLCLDTHHSNAYDENMKLNLQVLNKEVLNEDVFNQAATIDPRLTSLDWQWSAESFGIEMDTMRSMPYMGGSQVVSYVGGATSSCIVQTATATNQVNSAQLSQRLRFDGSFAANAYDDGQIAIAQHGRRYNHLSMLILRMYNRIPKKMESQETN
ncbi:uncharacterized protein BO95DRAFT_459938 [Aspergillus brunneoviolaceus CBS 621.78]|uniref:Uncharacterized protein n=1 Tax=Aspergillus brunneoviolaceus CBS 621.78 TaxID=1450534 RepID=A0ACD1GKE0_9EURO|nr:hypothetical protein BO95DRAFT_459938 [Aspergillus brunneoviolaceus CBS 621.78]RAH49546.1 hypothetical protein BO95DRAFT_459938 [Aspergillus brunneoviolaceus CBS 621.78]